MKKIITGFTILALAIVSFVPAYAAQNFNVSITDDSFVPKTLTINVGDRVTWTNNDDEENTLVSNNGDFDSGPIPVGGVFSHTFGQTGTFRYHSTGDETRMSGTIIVSPTTSTSSTSTITTTSVIVTTSTSTITTSDIRAIAPQLAQVLGDLANALATKQAQVPTMTASQRAAFNSTVNNIFNALRSLSQIISSTTSTSNQ